MEKTKEELADLVVNFKSKTYAESTRRSYSCHLRKYLNFCTSYNFVPVPASQEQIELYTVYLSQSLQYTSLSKYLNIIRIVHLEAGFINPLDKNFSLDMLLRGIKRELGASVNRKLPITPEILVSMYKIIDTTDVLDIIFWAACLVGFHALLRKSNLFSPGLDKFNPANHLSRSHLHWRNWGIELEIRWSKTIQFRERKVSCPLLRTSSILCPVWAVQNVLDKTTLASPSGPLFVYQAKGAWRPYLYCQFLRRLREVLEQVGLPATSYAAHSLRRGGASWALKCGVPGEVIQSLGDWKSDAYMNYLDVSTTVKMSYLRHMSSCLNV